MSYAMAIQTKVETPPIKTLVRALLVCGIISSALYVGSDVLAAWSDPGYSYANQSYSELLAIGSATRPYLLPSAVVYNLLVIACAVGVWAAAEGKRALRITSVLLLAYGLTSLAGPFVPMHERGSAATLTDVLHIACTIVLVLSILAAMSVGVKALGKRFGVFSAVCLSCVVAFAALTGVQAGRMAEGLPTPGMGILERGNIYAIMLWVAVLAIGVLRSSAASCASGPAWVRHDSVSIGGLRIRETIR